MASWLFDKQFIFLFFVAFLIIGPAKGSQEASNLNKKLFDYYLEKRIKSADNYYIVKKRSLPSSPSSPQITKRGPKSMGMMRTIFNFFDDNDEKVSHRVPSITEYSIDKLMEETRDFYEREAIKERKLIKEFDMESNRRSPATFVFRKKRKMNAAKINAKNNAKNKRLTFGKPKQTEMSSSDLLGDYYKSSPLSVF